MTVEIDKVYNCDCLDLMQAMKEQGLKADWCITDPPYGIGVNNNMGRRRGDRNSEYKKAYWDKVKITKPYFDLIFDTSDNQFIFGGNYYTDILPPSKSWFVWDKILSDELSFSQVELAWTSADFMSKIYKCFPNGKDKRIHPTQKPVELLMWVLNKYTKDGDLILDPFAGSQSLRIACHKMKRHYIGAELDKEYYEKGCAWFNQVASQISIFDMVV